MASGICALQRYFTLQQSSAFNLYVKTTYGLSHLKKKKMLRIFLFPILNKRCTIQMTF